MHRSDIRSGGRPNHVDNGAHVSPPFGMERPCKSGLQHVEVPIFAAMPNLCRARTEVTCDGFAWLLCVLRAAAPLDQ